LGGPSAQFRVLGLGLLKDGDVGVGVFPEREEILISGAGFGGVALQGIGASEAEMRKGDDGALRSLSTQPHTCSRRATRYTRSFYN
jgi:hypothetical protein